MPNNIDFSGAIGSAVQGLLNIGSTAIANNTQRKMQREQNAFNAQQADLNRQFQSREAEIARDWQEQQYIQYSSPSAMVRQYNEAGLNPALMYGSNLQSSTGSTSAPSGSAASGSTPSAFAADMTGIASAFLGLAKLKQDIKESQSRENANNAAAFASEREGYYKNSLVSLNGQNIKESKAKIQKMIEETHSEKLKQSLLAIQPLLTREEIKLKRGQQINLSYDTFKKQFEYQYKEKFGFYPEDSSIKTAFGILGEAVRNIEFGFSWIGSKLGF